MVKRSKPKSGSQPKKRASKKNRGATASATRKTADWLTSSLTSPLVREAVAAALVAGARAAAAVFAVHSGSSGKKKIRSASSVLSDATQDVTDAAVEALAGAATDAVKGQLPGSNARGQSSRPAGTDS